MIVVDGKPGPGSAVFIFTERGPVRLPNGLRGVDLVVAAHGKVLDARPILKPRRRPR